MARSTLALAIGLALAFTVLPGPATAHDDEGDTLLFERGRGTLEVTPGLCVPGGTPDCQSAPSEAQFRVRFTECTISGTFEGTDLDEAPCDGTNHGRIYGVVLGWTGPACASTYSRTTDDTTAWSSDEDDVPAGRARGRAAEPADADDASDNTHTIDGITRNESFEVRSAGAVLEVNGWLDDADADDDPVGDHSLVAEVRIRPTTTGACVTHPATEFTFESTAIFR